MVIHAYPPYESTEYLRNNILLPFAGVYDILVCTTIVENGLDIPRVNTIIVRDVHMFGLSQLYQLRGRVGRAGAPAYALMFYTGKFVWSWVSFLL